MRAPPEADTTSNGTRRSAAISAARAIFSPTTDPIEPPMKRYSIAASNTSCPSRWPSTTTTASLTPTSCW